MIRGLVLILGLALGLAAAVVTGGRVAHLRALGVALPDWAQTLPDDAGLSRGAMTLRGARLEWRLAGFDMAGPRWRVVLTGPDWQVEGSGRPGLSQARVSGLRGVLGASALAEGAAGLVAVEDGTMTLALPSGVVVAAQIDGQARGLVLGGPVPDGAVVLTGGAEGWSAAAR